MVSVTEVVKCPECGFYNEETQEGLIIEYQTRTGEVFAGCVRCNYGYRIIRVPVCVRCGEELWKLLASTDDLELIRGLKHCPICNSAFIRWELMDFNKRCSFVSIPQSALHPMEELIGMLEKEKEHERAHKDQKKPSDF